MRICKICETEKPMEKFYKHRRVCIKCLSKGNVANLERKQHNELNELLRRWKTNANAQVRQARG